MQTVTLRYTESDPEYGIPGWNVVKRGNQSLDISEIQASEDSRLLAHDILEHWDFRQIDANLQELVALGSTLAHRENDFINHYTGYNSFASEVARHLYYFDFDGNDFKLPRSSSTVVKDTLDESWQDILKTLADEFEYVPTNSRKLKSIAYRFLSRGYNHVNEIDKRCNSSYRFNSVFEDMKDVLKSGLKYVDKWEDTEVNLKYSFTKRKVELFQSFEIEDDNGCLIRTVEHLASN